MINKAVIIGTAAVCGLLLTFLKIPAGAMVGAMLGTAISQRILNARLDIPVKFRRLVRIGMGIFVGLGITAQGVMQIRTLILPGIIVIVGVCLLSLLTFAILYKFFKFDYNEAVFSSVPAGLSEIAVNIEGLNVDPAVVSLIHLFRLSSVEIIFPIFLRILHLL
ncbi:MAG: AbrB family transcriptional regulator [Peptococcaceae bacterium]